MLIVGTITCTILFLYNNYCSENESVSIVTIIQLNDFLSSWKINGGGEKEENLAVHVLDFMGSLICCRVYHGHVQGQKHWLESLLVCFIMQFGGTTLTGIILGQPAGWMLGTPLSASALAMLLAWWLVFCCPREVFIRIMDASVVMWHVPELLSTVSCGHAITTWGVDKVSQM
jgi:hypothetical protein